MVESIHHIQGVKGAKAEFNRDRVTLTLTLAPDADLAHVVSQARRASQPYIGKRQLSVDVESSDSAKLESIWQKALFDIAQAMETKKYSDIPAALEKLQSNRQDFSAATQMDTDYVYISMKDDQGGSKFVILPRHPNKMGVWPNE